MGGKPAVHTRVVVMDYDCFYASVFEAENPVLKSLPLAVQQKQIVVTCNYEARRRGLRKLQLIKDAKRICPDVVIILGEDLTKFRDASKELFSFLQGFVWGGRLEKLGFDEVFLDVTPMIDYNMQVLNRNDLANSFFQVDKSDPTVGFPFDATVYCGPTYPPAPQCDASLPDSIRSAPVAPHAGAATSENALDVRLRLGSHLANHLRLQLEEHKRYTATVGISTSKLLAKLAGNAHKPRNQTTLLPPYTDDNEHRSNNVIRFLDCHDIGRIPGIGSKIAHRLRSHVLGREVTTGHYETLREEDGVNVGTVRTFPGIGPSLLDDILRRGGWHKDIGSKVWRLVNGIDDERVAPAGAVPTQISIEDSYSQLDNLQDVQGQLTKLACSLIRRMRADLTEDDDDDDDDDDLDPERVTPPADFFTNGKPGVPRQKRWLAHPRTLRLSTRVRLPPNPDGSINYNAPRVSRSGAMPQFIFSLHEDVESRADRLVREALLPMFRRLHPETFGWKLSLINVAATNMVDAAGTAKTSAGLDIGKMFRTQEQVLREWKIEDRDSPPDSNNVWGSVRSTSGHKTKTSSDDDRFAEGCTTTFDGKGDDDGDDGVLWQCDDDSPMPSQRCPICGVFVPHFALNAHEMYHTLGD